MKVYTKFKVKDTFHLYMSVVPWGGVRQKGYIETRDRNMSQYCTEGVNSKHVIIHLLHIEAMK